MEQFDAENKPLISVIIPAYNAEKYISLTIDSILKQTGSDGAEVVVINDGSTDSTADILDKYKEQGKIRVINTNNKGPANARNVGIRAACGEYVMFVDSDDTLCMGALEALEYKIQKTSADLIVFGFRLVNEKQNKELAYFYENTGNMGREELGKHLIPMYQKNMLNQVWNKVYRRNIIIDNNIIFPEYRYGEDRLFIFEILACVHSAEVISEVYYNYCMRDNDSLVSRYCPDKFNICCEIDEKIRNLAEQMGVLNGDNKKILNYMFIKSEVSCMTNLFERTCPLKRREKRSVINGIVSSRRCKEAAGELPENCGASYRIIAGILSLKNVTVSYLFAFMTTKIIKIAPALFIRIKHSDNRNSKA